MRDATAAQLAALLDPYRRTRIYLEIEDGAGVWRDMTTWLGHQWVARAHVSGGEDQPSVRATIDLHREMDGLSLSPLMTGSSAHPDNGPIVAGGRRVRVGYAVDVHGSGSSTGREELFAGRIDDDEFGGFAPVISLECRDQIALLQAQHIEEPTQYGPGPLEDVLQKLLDDWLGAWAPQIVVQGDPDFWVSAYTQRVQSLWDAVQALTSLNGWDFRERRIGGEFRLVLSQPVTDPASADQVFTADHYSAIPALRRSSLRVRDKVILKWADTGTAEDVVTVSTPEPLTGPFHVPIYLDESSSGQLQTREQGEAMAAAALQALGRPPLGKQIDGPFFPLVEPGDWIEYEPENVLYDTPFSGAVTSYQHTLVPPGEAHTSLQVQGAFGGHIQRWEVLHERTKLKQDVEEQFPAAPPPKPGSTGDLQPGANLYYTQPDADSGFSAESDAESSLGTWVSTTRIATGLNGLFRAVTPDEQADGITLYKAMGLANESEGHTWRAVKGWIEGQGEDGATWAIGLDPAGVVDLESATAQGGSIEDEATAPTGVTFSAPEAADGLSIGDMGPRTAIVVWVRLTVDAGAETQITGASACFGDCLPSEPPEV